MMEPAEDWCRGALAVVDIAGAVLESKNLTGLRELSEQRVVTRVLGGGGG